MPFNHYDKIKRILIDYPNGWFIKQINESTSAKNFKGEIKKFYHYYRIYDTSGKPIKYCKFQQIDLLAKVLNISIEDLPVTSD